MLCLFVCTCTHRPCPRLLSGEQHGQIKGSPGAGSSVEAQHVLTPRHTRALCLFTLEPYHLAPFGLPSPVSGPDLLLSPYPSGHCCHPVDNLKLLFLIPPSPAPQLFSSSLGKGRKNLLYRNSEFSFPIHGLTHRCLSNIRKRPNWKRNCFLSTFIHIQASISMT